MEKIAARLTDYIFKKGLITEENYEIYQYGFVCFLEFSIGILSMLIISISVGMFWEGLFFILIFMPLRSFGGGLHLKKFVNCYITSCLILLGTLLIVKYFSPPNIVSLIIVFVFAVVLLLLGPVDHPNREVDADENKVFVRRTVITVFVCMALAIALFVLNKKIYLFLEAVVFTFLLVTNFIGKLYNAKE